jgi:hypothetical protein
VAEELTSELFNVLFDNIERYLSILKLHDSGQKTLDNAIYTPIQQSTADELADDMLEIEKAGGLDKMKRERKVDSVRHRVFFNRIVEKLTEQDKEGKQDLLTTLRGFLTKRLDNLDERPLL